MSTISVVIPVYNVEKYLDKCIESIIRQTYKKFEVILIDDGSTDSSGKLCDNWADKDPRIQVIHQKNRGSSAARNAGIRRATGEFLVFIDSDDYVSEHLFEHFIQAMDRNTDWALCRYEYIYPNNDSKVHEIVKNKSFKLDSSTKKMDFLLKILLQYKVNFELWGKCFRTSLIQENHLLMPEGIHLAEDMYFCTFYTCVAKNIKILDYVGYHYIEHGDSVMRKFNDEIYLDMMNELVIHLYQEAEERNWDFLLEEMPMIHGMYMNQQYQKIYLGIERASEKLVEAVNKIQNIDFCHSQTSALLHQKRRLLKLVGWKQYAARMPVMRYMESRDFFAFNFKYQILLILQKISRLGEK
ncbi:MAG: glycosyltransferase [Lachnospiraceae bacterium]|nr:glycosyltransferase [Lachnospiraceae bacterium]